MDLSLRHISHRYDDVEVLHDINLDIKQGEIVCIIGPSGCGKSTLLRFIGGLERPTAGDVIQVGAAPTDSLNPLTYIFQDFALLPWRTVEGNISLALEDHACLMMNVAFVLSESHGLEKSFSLIRGGGLIVTRLVIKDRFRV